MANANSSTATGDPPPSGPIEQLLVMHCLKEDSVLGREGFSVRAASPGANDPATFDWVLRLDSYELPLDMRSGTLPTNQAPRRLAMVPGPSGRVALVHTTYLPEDTVGRPHSFISQILLLPSLDTLSAVTAWGSSDWMTDEYPRGETKVLPTIDHLPQGSLIDEAALTNFLSAGAAPADQSVARSIYPGRVESNLEARRRWIPAALHGFLRAGEPNGTRTRVCILAEPGAVAFLIYATARLLPPRIAGTFPFSTYEPPHSSLRENKVARVIGSYARNGLEKADSDGLRRRGYVVDTFRDAYGPELMIEASWQLEDLLKLVADGDWKAVDEVRDLWSRDPRIAGGATPASLAEALQVRPLAVALKAGALDADGLMKLRRNRFGEGLLRDDEFRGRAWQALRKVWAQPRIRQEFADLLREHLDELLREVRDRVHSGPAGAWREGWEALKSVIPADRRAEPFVALMDTLGATPGAAALSPDDRGTLLREWSQSAPAGTALPARLQWLLRAPDSAGFRGLARSAGIEPRFVGLAACFALSGSAGWEPGPDTIKDLSDDQFSALINELTNLPDRAAVYERLRSQADLIRVLVERLLPSPVKPPPDRVEEWLSGMRCDQSLGPEFWLENRRLEGLLDCLATDSPLSRRIWAKLVARLTPENFDDGRISGEMQALVAARERFPGSLAPEDLKRLDGWNTLRVHFGNPPKSPPSGTGAQLRTACDAVGLNREDLIGQWFARQVLRTANDLKRKSRNEVLGHALLGFHESEDAACATALKLAEAAKDRELRIACKTELFNAIVSDANRDRLARRHEEELRETHIQPQLSLREPARTRDRSKKGLGVGSLRLPPEATPYAGAFVGGTVFGVLFALLLSSVIPRAIDSVSASLTSNRGRKVMEPGGKELEEVRAQLESKERELEESQAELAKRQTRIAELESTVASRQNDLIHSQDKAKQLEGELLAQRTKAGRAQAAAGGNAAPAPPSQPATTMVGTGKNAPSATAAKGLQGGAVGPVVAASPTTPSTAPKAADGQFKERFERLNRSTLIEGLHKEKVKETRDLARNLTSMWDDETVREAFEGTSHLLDGLSAEDVPQVTPGKVYSQDTFKSDFIFLHSKDASRAALVTLSAQYLRAGYTFETGGERLIWTDMIPRKDKERRLQYSFLSASPSGDFALTRLSNESWPLMRINSNKFYGHYFVKNSQVDDFELTFNIPETSTVPFPISNRGELYAVLTNGGALQAVEIRQFDPRKPVFTLDLGQVADELKQGHLISKMSFDSKAKTFAVSLKNSKSLLLFRLDQATVTPPNTIPNLTPEVFSHPAPIIDWGYSFDGDTMATATQSGILMHDLPNQGASKSVDVNLAGRNEASISSVAFDRRGTYLAVGYDDGIVAIRDLRHDRREVLRLWHEGPVQKLGFSPDGRVLAVLVLTVTQPRDRRGFIRLWVTEKW